MASVAEAYRIEFTELCLIWRVSLRAERLVVGTLECTSSNDLRFVYDGPDLERAAQCGFEGYPGLRLGRTYGPAAVNAFAARLPSAKRPDYGRFLSFWRIEPDARDPVYLLAATGGRLPTDMFEFIPRILPRRDTCFLTDLAGVRIYGSGATPGGPIKLEPEPTNAVDAEAVKVLRDGRLLAYVKKVHNWSVQDAWRAELEVSARLEPPEIQAITGHVMATISYS